jgi:hypothetical protein
MLGDLCRRGVHNAIFAALSRGLADASGIEKAFLFSADFNTDTRTPSLISIKCQHIWAQSLMCIEEINIHLQAGPGQS